MKNAIFGLLVLFLPSHPWAQQQATFDRTAGPPTSKNNYSLSADVILTKSAPESGEQVRNDQSVLEALTRDGFVGGPAFGSTPEVTRQIGNSEDQNNSKPSPKPSPKPGPKPAPKPGPVPVPDPVDPTVCMCIPGVANKVRDNLKESAVKIGKGGTLIQKE